jgi:hypothetical protein
LALLLLQQDEINDHDDMKEEQKDEEEYPSEGMNQSNQIYSGLYVPNQNQRMKNSNME